MEINLEDYKLILKLDCNDRSFYGAILLNKKHTVKEFQEEIYRAKEQARKEIEENGDDWYYITKNMSEDFNYIELGCDEMKDFVDF